MNLYGAYEPIWCGCCGKRFWAQRSATLHTLCDSLTLMPCNIGTPGAILRPVGPCCAEQVLDMSNSLPPPGDDVALDWRM